MSCHNGSLEKRIESIGRTIYSGMSDTSPTILNPVWWSGHLLKWAMKDESFKIQLFRFIDLFPALSRNRQVTRFFREYFEEIGESLPEVFRWGINVSTGPMMSLMMAPVVRRNLNMMAHRFITGKDPEEGANTLAKLRKKGMALPSTCWVRPH